MDQQLSERGLSLRPFDPEVFARVWSRVMPDQALSPIQPALPALRSPALAASAPEPSPAPSCLGEGSARYAPQLEALMDQLHTALSSVRQLARRGGGRAAGLARTVSDDPCLSRLLEDIQDEAQSHAAQIRVLLEGLL